MKLSRGFKNFLGFVFAVSALYGITSKPDFFEIIVAVGCVVIAVLLFKPTEAEKAAKAEKAANVSLDEIKKVVRDNYDKSVEFIETPPAEQYRESLLLREAAGTNV